MRARVVNSIWGTRWGTSRLTISLFLPESVIYMNRGLSNRQAVVQGWLAGRSVKDILWDVGSRATPNWVIKILRDLGQWSDQNQDEYKKTGDARLAKD